MLNFRFIGTLKLPSKSPGGGLDKPTDRDQRSWVFLNDPKNILPLTENPQKILSKK